MTQTKEQIHEDLLLWDHVLALEKAGKKEEALEFRKKHIPLPAWGAKVMKKFLGAEYVRNSGYDLSLAEARFGKDWLNH
jgi:hypothetical protein